MIVGCPNCNRKYQLGQEYSGKFIKCLCKNVLKVPEISATPMLFTPGAAGGDFQGEDDSVWSQMLLPTPTALFDFDRYGDTKEQEEEPVAQKMPSLDEEMPSFDEDGDLSGMEEIEYELPDLGEEEEEEEMTNEQQGALEGLDVAEAKPLDPRLPKALGELKESTEPRFIVDLLYFLLEVKDLSIEEAVEIQLQNKNPISQYFSKRILKDLSKMKGAKPEKVPEFPRTELFSDLFFGNSKTKIDLVDKALENRWFAAMPYFVVQLMRERDVDVICEYLSRLGLLATALETPFFGKFIRHNNRRVRLACIEGLSGIGGPSVLPSLVCGLGETDPDTATAVKSALKGSDKISLAREIRNFLSSSEVPDKTGYIAVLKEHANPESFRTLVWLLKDPSVRSYALSAIRDLPIEDDLKIPHLEEFLMLTNDDTTFCHEIVEFMEVLQPSFDATRLVPITVFDDSYIGQVRFSPLFAKDFEDPSAKKDEVLNDDNLDIRSYDLQEEGKQIGSQIKTLSRGLKFITKSSYFHIHMALYALVLIPGIALVVFSFLKGMGSAPLSSLPTQLVPPRFMANFGMTLFTDTNYSQASTIIYAILSVDVLIGWFLGSSLAVGQLRSGSLAPRLLPSLPLLLSPVLLGYSVAALNQAFGLSLVKTTLTVMFLFPCTSIFYLIYLRMFSLHPKGGINSARYLGSESTGAYATTYGPIYHVGTVISALLCVLYLLGSLSLSYFLKSDSALGYVILEKTRYFEGWLMVGSYGASLALIIIIFLFLIEMFVPLSSLFPGGTPLPAQGHPIAQRWSRWLGFLGWVFYSRAYMKKVAKKIVEESFEIKEPGDDEPGAVEEESKE